MILKKQIKALYQNRSRPSINAPFHRELSELESIKLELGKLIVELGLVTDGGSPTNSYNAAMELLNDFIVEFAEANVPTIDTYLARRTGSQASDWEVKSKIGRVVISYLIRHHELRYQEVSTEDDWIQDFIRIYLLPHGSPEKFVQQPPKFISFNYDNLFERTIFRHLHRQHGFTRDQAADYIKKLNVMHVYGDLKSFNDESTLNSTPFHDAAVKNIKIIGEDRSSEQLEQASQICGSYFNSSNTICFMGFGFDKENCEILFKHKRSDHSPTLYTTNMISKLDLQAAKSHLPHSLNHFPKSEVDCKIFITERLPKIASSSESIPTTKSPSNPVPARRINSWTGRL